MPPKILFLKNYTTQGILCKGIAKSIEKCYIDLKTFRKGDNYGKN